MSSPIDVQKMAARLDHAVRQQTAIAQLSAETPFDLATAYQIQNAGIALREARGEKRIGLKLGFTSRAKMIQMGVDHLIWGELTDEMQVMDGETLDLNELIHPRVEPEICFVTKTDIHRPLSLAECQGVLESVAPALEIIDSRYSQFRFSLEDVIADNCSSARFVVGAAQSPRQALDNLGVTLRFNGRQVQTGSSAAILGHPLRALVQISSILSQQERTLPAGSIILAGAATAAEALTQNSYIDVDVNTLGRAAFYTRG